MPKRSSSNTDEPVVRPKMPMPRDYAFVPKGDVYMTSHCRKETRAAGATVYAVVDGRSKRGLGIRVPVGVVERVRAAEAATRGARREAVEKRDEALAVRFRAAVARLFPGAPQGDGGGGGGRGADGDVVGRIVARAVQKSSGRVGRTGKLELDDKATLAVRAHVRHCHTDYDKLLRDGVQRKEARVRTLKQVEETVKAWGGKESSGRAKGGKNKGSKSSPSKNNKKKGQDKGKVTEKKTAKDAKIKNSAKSSTATSSSSTTQNDKKSTQPRTLRSGHRLGSKSKPSSADRTPPSPKDRRVQKLRTRRDRAAAATKNGSKRGQSSTQDASFGDDKFARSLKDDLSDVEESDEYVDSDDSYDWLGTDEEEEEASEEELEDDSD
jgi:hypothetical protein